MSSMQSGVGDSPLSMEEDGQRRLRVFLANCRLEHLTFALISAEISSMDALLHAAKELDQKLPSVGASQGDIQRLKAAIHEVVPESIKEFLASAGLDDFYENLVELGVETMEDLFDDHLVTEESLALVGVPKPKARILLRQRQDLAERSPKMSRRISVANTLNPAAPVPAATPPHADEHVIRVKIPQGASAGSVLKVPVVVHGKKVIFSVAVPNGASPGSEVNLRVRIPKTTDGVGGGLSPTSRSGGGGGATPSPGGRNQLHRAASLSATPTSARPTSGAPHSASFNSGAAEASDKPMTSIRALRKSAARYTGMRGVFSGKFRSKSTEGSSDADVRRVLVSVSLATFIPQFVEFGIRSIEDMIESEIVPDDELAGELGMNPEQVKRYREVVATAKQAIARGEPWDSGLPAPAPVPSAPPMAAGPDSAGGPRPTPAALLQEFLMNTGVGHASLALSSLGIESLESFAQLLHNEDLRDLLINEVGLTFDEVQRCRTALTAFSAAHLSSTTMHGQPTKPPQPEVPQAKVAPPLLPTNRVPAVLDGVPEADEDDEPGHLPEQHVYRMQTMRLQESAPAWPTPDTATRGHEPAAQAGEGGFAPVPAPPGHTTATSRQPLPEDGEDDMQKYASLIRATMRYHQAQEQSPDSR